MTVFQVPGKPEGEGASRPILWDVELTGEITDDVKAAIEPHIPEMAKQIKKMTGHDPRTIALKLVIEGYTFDK